MLPRAVVSSLAIMLLCSAAGAAGIFPAPQRLIERGQALPVSGAARITLPPGAGPIERYAADRLGTLLAARFGLEAALPEGSDATASLAIRLTIAAGVPGPEGCRLRVGPGARGAEVTVEGSDPSGLLYGALTVPQLLRRQGDAVRIRQVEIEDRPAVPVRAIYVVPDRLGRGWGGEADRTGVGTLVPAEVYRGHLDWLAENRINLVDYEVARDVRPPVNLADLVREAHRRGMRFFGGVRYVGSWRKASYICASDPAQVEQVLRIYDAFLDAGCDGVTYLADDIARPYLDGHCDRCRQMFGGLAGEQAFLLRRIADRVMARGVSPENIYFCPTYYHGYDREHEDYSLTFARDPVLRRIPFFLTTYDPSQIARFRRETGLDYLWWYNGPRSISYYNRGKTNYAQLDAMYYPLMSGWHGLRWDWERGFLPDPQVTATFAQMAEQTRVFWMCCGGGATIHSSEYAHAMWGIYAWHPAAFRQDAVEARVMSRLIGAEAAQALKRANDACFGAYTVVEPTRAASPARIGQALARARVALSAARTHYDRFWETSGRFEFGEPLHGFVLNTFARYAGALDAAQPLLKEMTDQEALLRKVRSAAVRDLSAPSRWALAADGHWRAEATPTGFNFSLPGGVPQPAGASARAVTRVALPGPGAYQVVFSVTDSYTRSGTPPLAWPGHIVKQVAVNGKVIWQDDVEGNEDYREALQAAEFEGRGEVEIALRAAAVRDIGNMGVTVTLSPVAVIPVRLGVASAFVEVPHHADLNPSNAMTILARVRFGGDVASKQFLFAKAKPLQYFCYLRDRRLTWGVFSGKREFSTATHAVIEPGSEHLVACIKDGERLRIALDGRVVAEGAAPASVEEGTGPLLLGGLGHDEGLFRGAIADIGIYQRALALPSEGAVARWQPGDPRAAGPVPDLSPAGHDGYLRRTWGWEE